MEEGFHIQWHLTNQCNLRCRHCYQDDFSKECELDLAGLEGIAENILDAMRSLNRKLFVHLTGGEPFLKPELFPLLGKLNHEPSVEELGIITNGTLLNEEVVSRLALFPKLKKMKISLDGADPETNDGIRSPGTFKRILQNLSLLKKDRTFEIIFMFTLMRRNYRNLPSFILLCQDLGVDGMILERFIPLGKGREVRDQVLGREEWKEVVMNFLEDSEPHPYQAFEILFKDDEMEFLGAPCVIGGAGSAFCLTGPVFPARRFPS